MIVGISMHQASGAGLGHHYPATLDHNNMNGASVAAVVGAPSADRLNFSTGLSNEVTTENYPMHQYQQYDSFNSSHQSHYSALYKPTEDSTSEARQFDETQQLSQHSEMMGLEQQFVQFGIQNHEQQHVDQAKSNQENKNSEETENTLEGDDTDEDPVKMFVGQIPKSLNEEDIFPTFNSFGPLKDVTVIRDKHTGIHRGCAFVTYWSATDAETAREALHDKFIFPGAKRATQVKPAEPSGMMSNSVSTTMGYYNTGISAESSTSPENSIPSENKLFVGMLSRTCDEQEVRYLFSRFGEIHEVHLIRDADGTSKCAAFLRFEHKESALRAIEQLNGVEVMDGAQRPLIVKFADSKQQRQQRHIRNVRRHELLTMVGPGGYPYHPQAPPMLMGMHPSVASQYSLPPNGSHHQHYGPGDYGHNSQTPTHHYMYPPHFAAPIPQYAYPPQQLTTSHQQLRHDRPPTAASSSSISSNSNPRPREGPAGANLFVYHLPHDLTDADLATAFNPFGNVISAKVYVDKFTGESKGFGFVSYDSVIAAEQAIEQMNGFQIGNKRLKVQHKRVHGSHGGGPSSLHLDSNSSQPSSGNNSTVAETE